MRVRDLERESRFCRRCTLRDRKKEIQGDRTDGVTSMKPTIHLESYTEDHRIHTTRSGDYYGEDLHEVSREGVGRRFPG